MKAKAILGSALIAVLALGFSFYVMQLLYLGYLLMVAGRADTDPSQSASFRHVAVFLSFLVAGLVFVLFYRRQRQTTS